MKKKNRRFKLKVNVKNLTSHTASYLCRCDPVLLSCDRSGLHTCNYCFDAFGWI